MSNQGAAQVIDITFDHHKVSQQSGTFNTLGSSTAVTLKFTPLNRVTFLAGSPSVYNVTSAATIATVQGPWLGTTKNDYNVVGFTVIVAAGNTVTLNAVAYGI